MIIRPEFFDIFGLAVFSFITAVSLWGLKTHKPMPPRILITLLLIGIAGLLVDGIIVYITYF